MPTQPFENLSEGKKQRVKEALLREFSHYDLADAQVARVVKDAGIARGAFYKYFTDLPDAYQYVYRDALLKLHGYDIRTHHLLTADEYADQVAAFLSQVNSCPYCELIKRHFTVNAALLQSGKVPQFRPVSPIEWAVMTLVHEAIKTGLQHPDQVPIIVDRLRAALEALLAKEN